MVRATSGDLPVPQSSCEKMPIADFSAGIIGNRANAAWIPSSALLVRIRGGGMPVPVQIDDGGRIHLAGRRDATGAAASHCREQERLAADDHIEALRLRAFERGLHVTPVS